MLTIRDLRRIIEAKYDVYVQRVIEEFKKYDGDPWERYVEDVQRGHSLWLYEECVKLLERACREVTASIPDHELELLWFESDDCFNRRDDRKASRGDWTDGVADELFNRVTEIAGDVDIEDHDEEEVFEFSDDELGFLQRVIEILEAQLTRPDGDSRSLQRLSCAISGLKALPQPTEDLYVAIDVAIHNGGETTFKSLSLSPESLEFTGGGSSYSPDVGSDSYSEPGFAWYTGGVRDGDGDPEEWLMAVEDLIACGASISVEMEGSEED